MECATLVLSAEVLFIFLIPSYFLHVFWLNPNWDNFDILCYLKIEIVFPLFIVSDLFPVKGMFFHIFPLLSLAYNTMHLLFFP